MTGPAESIRRGSHNAHIGGFNFSYLLDREVAKPEAGREGDPEFEAAAPKIRLRVCHSGTPGWKARELIFDAGTTWALFRIRDRYLVQNSSVYSENRPTKFLSLHGEMGRGVLYLDSKTLRDLSADDPIGYPLNQVLMIMLLSQGRGLLLHACGIDHNGVGYLFVGNSGHGKSTMARLWHEHGAVVLNDDRIVVREKDGLLWMYGTPWHGDFKEHSAGGLPIRKIFFLSRGNGNAVHPVQGAESVSMILTRSFPPLWDKAGMAFTMGFCHRITEKVPCHELSFEPDARIIDFVRNI